MALTTTELGKEQIRKHEGLRLTAYDDGAGNLTIGYGHKIVSDIPNKITREQAEELFRSDLAIAEAAVNRSVRVPLTSAQFDALVSLVFNWGGGEFLSIGAAPAAERGRLSRSAATALGASDHSWRGRDVGPPAATAGRGRLVWS